MRKVPIYKRILSYLYPVKIENVTSIQNPFLELFLYKNEWQLATQDALYSDGSRYQPLRLAFKEINKQLPSLNNVLVLGTGIGSAVQIFNKLDIYPSFTLVDNDKAILDLAIQLLSDNMKTHITPVFADAENFMKNNTNIYDLIIIDIFESRLVPPFVTTNEFLDTCKKSIRTDGILIFNYITNWAVKYDKLIVIMNQVFPNYKVLKLNLNKIFIAKV